MNREESIDLKTLSSTLYATLQHIGHRLYLFFNPVATTPVQEEGYLFFPSKEDCGKQGKFVQTDHLLAVSNCTNLRVIPKLRRMKWPLEIFHLL